MSTIFSDIINAKIEADIVYQDERVTAFWDIDPKAPVHILIVPKKEIPTVNDIQPEDEPLMGHIFSVAKIIAKQEGIAEDGFRLIVNCNRYGGQEIFHLHVHLVGGHPLGPMLMRR